MHRRDAPANEADPLDDFTPGRDDEDTSEGPEPLQGPVFGNMVHEILEQVDFEQVGQAPDSTSLPTAVLDLIEAKRREHWSELLAKDTADPNQVELCRQELARLVWLALQTPLSALGSPLWQVPKGDRLHELEFLYLDKRPEARAGSDYLTGSIDLVIRRDSRFFLVDWKTNYLDAYTPDALDAAMNDMGYHDQYRIYAQALERWLKSRLGKSFRFEKQFGGVYYLFLRGLTGSDETAGVFFRPTAHDRQLELVLKN
jgi:exodeoxyribonuclease V beta subunit